MAAITRSTGGNKVTSNNVSITLGKNTTTPSVLTKNTNDALFFKHSTKGK